MVELTGHQGSRISLEPDFSDEHKCLINVLKHVLGFGYEKWRWRSEGWHHLHAFPLEELSRIRQRVEIALCSHLLPDGSAHDLTLRYVAENRDRFSEILQEVDTLVPPYRAFLEQLVSQWRCDFHWEAAGKSRLVNYTGGVLQGRQSGEFVQADSAWRWSSETEDSERLSNSERAAEALRGTRRHREGGIRPPGPCWRAGAR